MPRRGAGQRRTLGMGPCLRCWTYSKAMAEHEEGRAGLAAKDMLPMVEEALAAADFMGHVTPAKLAGP